MGGSDYGGAFRGKSVFVTGAGSGLGAGMARRFAAAGARRVVLSCLHPGNAEAVAGEIRAAGGQARSVALDVTDAAAFEAAFAEAWAQEGAWTCSSTTRASASRPTPGT